MPGPSRDDLIYSGRNERARLPPPACYITPRLKTPGGRGIQDLRTCWDRAEADLKGWGCEGVLGKAENGLWALGDIGELRRSGDLVTSDGVVLMFLCSEVKLLVAMIHSC